jgi:hypothetical protein
MAPLVYTEMRTTSDVFESHLELRNKRELNKDIEENYSTEIVLISNHGTFKGHDGVRESAGILEAILPNASYKYELKLIEGDIAYLVWEGQSEDKLARGTDTFLIKSGKIMVQTIFY